MSFAFWASQAAALAAAQAAAPAASQAAALAAAPAAALAAALAAAPAAAQAASPAAAPAATQAAALAAALAAQAAALSLSLASPIAKRWQTSRTSLNAFRSTSGTNLSHWRAHHTANNRIVRSETKSVRRTTQSRSWNGILSRFRISTVVPFQSSGKYLFG